MNFLHYVTEWKHLKLKNIILNEENGILATENILLDRMNKAYEIENFNSGRKIAKLESENRHLNLLFHEENPKKTPEERTLAAQQLLSSKPETKETS